MTKHYIGEDRREEHGGGHWNGEERRIGEPCAVHTFVMENCALGKKETAEKLERLANNKLDWKIFVFVAMMGAGIIGAGFGWFGNQLAGVDKKYSDRDEKIASTLLAVSNIQAGMMVEISYLKANDALQEQMRHNLQPSVPK